MEGAAKPGPKQTDGSGRTAQGPRIALSWPRLRSAKATERTPCELELKGDKFMKEGKPAEALDYFSKAITENQGDMELWMKKADAFMALKRYRSALFCTDTALANAPARQDLWLMRALLLHWAGDNQTAIENVNYALSLKGDILEGWEIKAESLLELDKHDEARSCIQLAGDMAPDSAEVKALSAELERRLLEATRCPMCGEMPAQGEKGCPKCETEVLLEDGRLSIQKAKDANKGTVEAEELLNEARSLRDKGFNVQALKVIRPISDILGKDWKSGSWALQIIDEAEDVSEALETDELVGTASIREKTERVRDAIKDGQQVRAIMLAREALALAKKIAQKYSTMLLKDKEKRKVKKMVKGPVCPNCSEDVDPEWVKCPACKTVLKEMPKKAEAKAPVGTPGELGATDGGVLYCPACGEEVEDFWMKCLFCGAKLKGPGGGKG